ncbi:DUF4956 domain-containing protein [Candidatus Pseudothioglobus singularis]|nr:DUF4956 domain-containing protein [Candidatus Pseudothioglobus singularis]
MSELDSINFSVSNSIELLSFTLMMIGAWILAYIVALHYEKYFPHISRSQSMGKTIFTIAVITFLIISVVKSSLALSLGLVGALSIIRFRTPIKEPFELSYLFMAIAIGLGFGAQQWMPTTIVILFSLLILTIFSKNSAKFYDNAYFFYINIDGNIESNSIESNIAELSQNVNADISLRRLDQDSKSIQITLSARVQSKDELLELNKKLKSIFSAESISIVDSQKLVPF